MKNSKKRPPAKPGRPKKSRPRPPRPPRTEEEPAGQDKGHFGKPELLAPAGGPATWAAAVEAGADAVYLGLKEFSARAFAANFSLKDMAGVIDLSHEHGVKVFVAFNALAKETELGQALKNLDVLAALSPDALILQDLGLFRLIKKHFPQFEVHASTLMAVHSQSGLEALAGLGFDRAVLARELTLNEVDRLVRRSPLRLEMFIHGALCYSFSGLCLMSSFLGGKGSLRGACTQPCRRAYISGKKKGFHFSPTDLDASALMGRIREMPLAALKIEGRMKGARYVSNVVRAYRLLLDAPESDYDFALQEAQNLIEDSLGRRRSTGFLQSPRAVEGLAVSMGATSGLFLGKVLAGEAEGGLVELKHPLAIGDRLRVQFKKDDERQAFTLKEMMVSGQPVDQASSGDEAWLKAPTALAEGDLVFKVDSGQTEKEALASPLVKALETYQVRGGSPQPSPALKAALSEISKGPKPSASSKKPEIWYKIARAEDVQGLAVLKPDRIMLPLTTPNVKRLAGLRRRLGPLFTKVIWAFPPLDLKPGSLSENLAAAHRMGCLTYMLSNLGQLPLFDRVEKGRGRTRTLYADYRLNCLNTQAEAQLADLGFRAVTVCLESDEENLKALLARPAATGRLFYLYGRPALFTSRFQTSGLKDNLPVESPRQERFRIRQSADECLVFAERPVFLAPLIKYKSLPGAMAFIVDLEFDPKPLASAREINEAIHRGRPLKHASRFNLKRGLF